jgi:hypothetical protein
MKYIKLYESYVATLNSDYNPMVTNVPDIPGGYDKLADSFLYDLGKNYDLRKGKPFDKEIGNCAWFTQEFIRWCELQRIPMQIIYFPETEKAKDAHVAPYSNGLVIDFAYKQFSKDKKEKFKIGKPEDYKKFGYDPDKADILDEFPNWVTTIRPLKEK